MDIEQLHNEYHRIIEDYNLKEKADEIAQYLTSNKTISSAEFAKLFALSEKDAGLFIAYIHKGILYKEHNIDPLSES